MNPLRKLGFGLFLQAIGTYLALSQLKHVADAAHAAGRPDKCPTCAALVDVERQAADVGSIGDEDLADKPADPLVFGPAE